MVQIIPLPQGAGYGVVVGLGFFFAGVMMVITTVLRRYQREIITAEEFATAGRSVKTGLMASSVASSWTWALTLLTSTTQCYSHGVAGSFTYAAGLTVQIILFAYIGLSLKLKLPSAHTYLEIIKERYGSAGHAVFIFYGILTNILVTAMLLTGTSAVVSDLTGMNTVAACFLLPTGVILYTLFGGLKATFITDYIHTIIILVIIMVFWFSTFATNEYLGSPGAVYDKLREIAALNPVEGNAGGEYVTLRSKSGFIFFVINLVGNFGTVFLDNGYFAKIMLCAPQLTLSGYVAGGLSWFAIPWTMATTMGLACLALEDTPAFPTYPDPMSVEAANAGLALPNAAYLLLGKGGAVASLLVVFMACTSAMSAELVAVSSICTYDVYRTYIDPNASGRTLIAISHVSVVCFGFIMSGFATGLWYAGISMGYLYELMGIIISAGVLPMVLSILWKKQNTIAVCVTPILGTLLLIMSWLLATWKLEGEINVTTTFADDPMLTGNVVLLLSPLIFCPLLTYAFGPQDYDFGNLHNIRRVDETEEILKLEHVNTIGENGELTNVKSATLSVAKEIAMVKKDEIFEEDQRILKRSIKIAGVLVIVMTLCFVILWPMPMYGTSYIFSKKFFTGWVVVSIIWIFFTTGMIVIYPLVESRSGIYTTFRGIFWDLTGQGWKVKRWQEENPDKLHAVQSQISADVYNGEEALIAEVISNEKQ